MINRGTAEHYIWGQGCEGWHLVKHPELSVIEEQMPPNTFEVRHYHSRSTQFFYVLSGNPTIEINARREQLNPFDGVEIPAGTSHQIFNESDKLVRFIVVSQPHSHGDRVVVDAVQQERE